MAEEPGAAPMAVVAAACDGACSGNPGPGGWGALLRFADGSVHEMGGAEPASTNNRMELTAALALLEALKDLPRHPDLAIRTDSRYLIDGLQKWLPGWKRKGWRTASGGAVLNRDLWEQLDRSRLGDVALRTCAATAETPITTAAMPLRWPSRGGSCPACGAVSWSPGPLWRRRCRRRRLLGLPPAPARPRRLQPLLGSGPSSRTPPRRSCNGSWAGWNWPTA